MAQVETPPTSTYNRERSLALIKKKRIYNAYKEAKRRKDGIQTETTTDFEALVKSIPIVEEQIKIDAANRAERERLKQERYEAYLRSKEPKKLDEGIIDVEKEMTAEKLTKMADQVLMAKALEVDSKSAYKSESSEKVSSSGLDNEPDREVIGRDKLIKGSIERIKELTKKIETDKNDVERFCKENEKLMLENRKNSENIDKLKRTIKDSDERNSKTHKENTHLSGVLQAKEKLINQQLDEIANLKLQFQEAKIKNERINLKRNNYSSASFVLQHIVLKPIGKNKAGEDVYSDGTRVGYHKIPPPMCNIFTKKQSGLVNESKSSDKIDVEKLLENIDVTFNSQTDEDSIESEVVKNVVEKVLKSDSDSTIEDDECFLNNYIPKPKSQDNLSDEPTLVMYKMNGSDKLYSDTKFPIENVNVDKLKKVFKLVEIDVSEIEGLTSSKRFLNFQRDKSYYKKPSVPPRFHKNNQNRGFGGH
ncbi:uncharacterized protein LOC110914224 [Helianthus annuus]|uniref:uncharacterized protein LOC110914224 n=1 Tax=Helianthus annuus TaxID=4232 RepID=UPI000B9064A2|nr:uncharacterized protein LOC110914224 [Helianthus annuus]